MKKIIILLCCICGTALFAQNTSSVSAVEEVPNWPVMLANLPNTQVTSGVLLDKVVDYANITNFNTADKNISDSKHFTQALSELYKASDQTRFISTSALNTITATTTASNSVDIGIINTLFHRLNFNEDDASLTGVTYNGTQFSTVAGKSTFIAKKVIIATPLKEIVQGSSINFNFKTALISNNATTIIKTLTVSFDDGTTNATTIISNSAIVLPTKNIIYATTGTKTISFLVTFSDNTTLTTFATMYVDIPPATQTAFTAGATGTNDLCTETLRVRGMYPNTATERAASIPFPGYGETIATYGKIEYTAFYSYSNTAKKMLKPIIIVDGFDPKDKRKVQDCDCENDPACKLANSDVSFTWTTQTVNGQTINTPHVTYTFNPLKHTSIEDSMLYNISPTQQVNFMSELRTLGYDVIIINQPTYDSVDTVGNAKIGIDGGADYIERNALTLVSFIKNYIKPQQVVAGSTEGLVLIGPSMGGQITRYALAYMEKQFASTGNTAWKHNARLWVSVDSPHLGANIPVGAQANIWFMSDLMGNTEAQKSYDDLNSVAGKQQSIVNFEYARTLAAHNLQGSPFFTTYYNNLNSKGVAGSNGYPVSTSTFRKIAMINGSLAGSKQGAESQSFLNTKIYIRGLWPFQSSTITLARFHDSFMPGYGSTGQVFQGDGQTSRFSLHLFGGCNPCLPHPRYSLNVTSNDIRGSLDVVPGGYFKIGEILKNSIEGGASDAGFRSESTDYVASNSFIAAFSSLGHLSPWQNWSNPLNTNLACPSNKQTPFDSYWGSNTNTEHTSFSKEGVDWLKKELGDSTHPPVPQAPSFPIQANLLTGPDILCDVPNTNYSISDLCKVPSPVIYTQNGVTVNGWSVSSNLQIISSTGNSINVTGLQSGSGTITATFQNGESISKTITIYHVPSLPIPSGSFGVDFVDCYNDGALPINFFPAVPFGGIITYTPNILAHPLQSQTKNITVKYTNPCTGAYTTKTIVFYYQAPACSSAKMATDTSLYLIYPNPSSDIVNIDLIDAKNQPEINTTISGELFDIMGQSKSKVEINDNKATFSVKGLIKGIYVLKIYINDKVESHQIAVE